MQKSTTSMRYMLKILFFLLFLASPNKIFSETERYQSILFKPQKNEEYAQAWNVYFINDRINVQLSYVIGNLGPGELNNGYVIFVHENDQQITFIKELSSKQLTVKKNAFHYIFNQNSSLRHEGRLFSAKAVKKDTVYSIRLKEFNSFPLLENNLKLSDHEFINETIPLITDRAELTIQNQKTSNIQTMHGWGGIEHLAFNKLPDRYANLFIISRTPPESKMLILMGFQGNQKFKNKLNLKYFYLENYAVVKSGHLTEMKISEKDKSNSHEESESLPKNRIPGRITFLSGNDPACSIQISNEKEKGVLNVFSSITPVLRWIFHLFFTEPSVNSYISAISLKCKNEIFSGKAQVNYILLEKYFR
ncbi:MAG: hypothetical protein OEZ34_14635 [Spirochaetia bacterium]|nr:hypothetical protein [Spirochaetia bacterium]